MNVQVEGRRVFSSLPLVRFTTAATVLVALESLTCIALWLAGGDTLYLEDSVVKFLFTHSTFDLACMAAVRGIVMVAGLFYVERSLVRLQSVKRRAQQKSSRQSAQTGVVLMLAVIVITLLYALVKGIMILVEVSRGGWNQDVGPELQMSVSYIILCVVGVVFPGVDVFLAVISWYCVRRMLHVRRIRLIINETEDEEKEEDKDATQNASLRRIIALAKPEFPFLLVGCVCLVIATASTSLAPLFFGRVISFSLPGQTNCTGKYDPGKIPPNVTCTPYTIERMNLEVVYLVAIFAVGAVAVTFRAILFNMAGERFVARLRKKLFKAIINQEMGFFDKSRTGELTNRLAADTQVVQSAVTENLSMLARYTLQMLISIGLMFYINAKLTAVLLSVVPIIVVAAVQYGRFLKKIKKDFQDKLAHANSTAEESLSNIITVRSFSNEDKMVALYSEDIDKSYILGRMLALMIGTFMGSVSFFMYGAAALVLWYGGYLVWHGEINPGTLISLMLYTLNLAMSFAFLSNLYGEFMQAVGASVRIFQLLDRECNVPQGSDIVEPFQGEINFEGVNFYYPSRPEEHILKDLSFDVKPGQVVALVGPSGGGKSTVVKLIEYFYNLSGGRILLGGRDIRDLDPSWFRKHIGLVNQEPVLFACSIKDNICYGKEDASQKEIEDAARQANAHDYIMSFEKGYETLVGERGVRLSGGQKQRIAIARALLLNPDILLLDEATSALDAESEHLVKEAIDRAMKGRTVIVIAHRLSTVRNASQVIVIEHGRLVEQGTHDELIAADGIYKQLVIRQLTAGELHSEQSE